MLSRRRHALPGFGLTLGCTLFYLVLIVLLPLSAIVIKSFGLTWDEFAAAVAAPRALASYRVTLTAAFCATLFNAIFGLLLAWILVRYDFPGRRILDAAIDLPFALPTAVAGLTLTTLLAANGWLGAPLAAWDIRVTYTIGGITIAMAFTSLPFVVRSIQPVLANLEPELEEAGRSLGAKDMQIFRRIVFPEIFPAFLAGTSLAFARCLGEFGAVIFIAGNTPMKTEITALLAVIRLEEFDYPAAAALGLVMLLAAFVMLMITNTIQAWHLRYVTGRGL
jgi:sulfate transport system permease protein